MKKTIFRDATEISRGSNLVLNVLLAILAIICIYPMIFIFMISISSTSAILQNGYSIFPQHFDLEAYRYLFKIGQQILQSYLVTILVTVIGTTLSVLVNALFAYAISRDDFPLKRFFTILILIPLFFSGGLVPFYIVSVQILHLYNSFWSMVLPAILNTMFIVVLRTHFRSRAISCLIEAATIDGAGELRIFFQIVLPLSLPGLATIGLFSALGYWGDWYNALLFINDPTLTPIQALLMNIQSSMTFITQNAHAFSGNAANLIKSLPTETARMAIVILATVPILVAYPFFQRFFIKGLTVGGVKE